MIALFLCFFILFFYFFIFYPYKILFRKGQGNSKGEYTLLFEKTYQSIILIKYPTSSKTLRAFEIKTDFLLIQILMISTLDLASGK